MLDDLSEGMLEEHGNVTLTVNIMYINKIPIITSLSRAIQFRKIEMIKDKRKLTIIKSLQQVINTFHGRGFKYDISLLIGNSSASGNKRKLQVST